MSKFIILTQYYPPETGAPQNRLHSLSKFLVKNRHQVRVVTALPSYPKNRIFEGYRGRLSKHEEIDSVPVYRMWIYVSRSRGIFSRLLNYFSFVITSFFKLLMMKRADYLVCESPPLFLGITAVLISRIKRMKLVFNVSDLWPESAEKLNLVTNKFVLRLSYSLEAWIYRKSFLISGQTKGIVKSIESRFPKRRVAWFPNGVDFDFFEKEYTAMDWRGSLKINESDFVVLYAGIIGHAQGLEVILNAAEINQNPAIKFVIVGDGPEKERLVKIAETKKLTNVLFLPNLEKVMIPSLIQMCDVYIVPLKKLDLFKGAIPSKLFEPLAMGKPILLGVEGEAKELFIEEGKAGLFFEPENANELAERILILLKNLPMCVELGVNGKTYVKRNFDRQQIHQKFLQTLDFKE